MTFQAFEAALSAPDCDASRFYELIASQDFTTLEPLTVVGACLRTFCDASSSYIWRRWTGIALARMIAESSAAVEYLKQLHQHLHGLGAIFLSNAEREETKIVAGIVVRQALRQGIQYDHFWATEKVKNSVPNFPNNFGPRWMSEFQDFLDTLSDLALVESSIGPSIVYAVAVTASDGYRWRDSTEELLIAIVQAELMTTIAMDSALKELQFVDIPLAHIHDMRAQRSSLYDSQSRKTSHEPWDLIITLKANDWTYRLNACNRVGSEVTFLLEHLHDAKELENCIKEHQRRMRASAGTAQKAHPNMSASSPIHLGPLLFTDDSETLEQNEQQTSLQPHPFAEIKVSQPTAPDDQPLRTSVLQSSTRPSPSCPDTGSTMTITTHLEKSLNAKSTRAKCFPAWERSSGDNLPLKNVKSAAPGPKVPHRIQGKLKKVSRKTKMKASRQLWAESDLFDLWETDQESEMMRDTRLCDSDMGSMGVCPENQKEVKQAIARVVEYPKPRSKRKAPDEIGEEFASERESKKVTLEPRKLKPAVVDTSQFPNTEIFSQALPENSDYEDEMNPIIDQRASKQQRYKVERAKISSPSLRHPLIDTLVGSCKPAQSSKTPPKRLESPEQTPPNSPVLSPSDCQYTKAPLLPQTPSSTRLRLNDGVASHVSSSPLPSVEFRKCLANKARRRTDIEILSSNSKPVPASPNAESTAISGHADCDDVDQQKKESESQIAMSDPFRGRGSHQKATSFTRRLIGEPFIEGHYGSNDDESCYSSHSLHLDFPDIDHILSPETNDLLMRSTPPRLETFCAIASRLNTQSPMYIGSSPEQTIEFAAKQKETGGSAVQRSYGFQEVIEHQASELLVRKSSIEIFDLVADQVTSAFDKKAKPCSRNTFIQPVSTPQALHDVSMRKSPYNSSPKTLKGSRTKALVQERDRLNCDKDMTFIGDTGAKRKHLNTPSTPLLSSPPALDLPSGRSFNSTNSSSSSLHPMSTAEAEELEWEANLQPHQRSLHDLLIRVSKRVMHQIVEDETIVTDIVDRYAEDGRHLLKTFLRQYKRDTDYIFEEIGRKAKNLRTELEEAAEKIAKERKRVNAIAPMH